MHHLKLHRRHVLGLTAAAALGLPLSGAAQSAWPSRPIRLLVPYAAGGSTDILTRLVAQKLGEQLGQTVVVENRGGGGGSIGTSVFAKAQLDDHYFLMVTQSQMSINQFLHKDNLGYDPVADLVPVSLVAETTNAIVVPPSLPVTSFQGLIDHAKANPGKLSYSSAGIGSTGHLLNELIKTRLGIDVTHVPYRGNGPAMQAVVGGEVQFNTDNMPQLLSQIQAGRVRALAVTSRERWFQLPDVPTVTELGYPELTTTVWFALVGQARLPAEIVQRMNSALQATLSAPDFAGRLRERSLQATPSTPQQMADLALSERTRWKAVVEASGASTN